MSHKVDPRCASSEQRINLLIDGRLDAAGRRDLDRHLEDCGDCSRLLSSYRSFSGEMIEWGTSSVSSDLRDDIFMDAVMASIASAPNRFSEKGRLGIWASAATLIFLAAVVWLDYHSASLGSMASSGLLVRLPSSIGDISDSLASFPAMVGDWIDGLLPDASAVQLPVWLIGAGAVALAANAYFISRSGRRQVAA